MHISISVTFTKEIAKGDVAIAKMKRRLENVNKTICWIVGGELRKQLGGEKYLKAT
jgi:hypothetical protein